MGSEVKRGITWAFQEPQNQSHWSEKIIMLENGIIVLK